jgi:hypothetical protein
LTEIDIHLPDGSLAEASPLPVVPLTQAVSLTIFAKSPVSFDIVLVSGDYCGEQKDIEIEGRRRRLMVHFLQVIYI